MEYAPGVKINRAAEIEALGVDRKLLAQRAVESYLQQLLTHGFFHAGGVRGRGPHRPSWGTGVAMLNRGHAQRGVLALPWSPCGRPVTACSSPSDQHACVLYPGTPGQLAVGIPAIGTTHGGGLTCAAVKPRWALI